MLTKRSIFAVIFPLLILVVLVAWERNWINKESATNTVILLTQISAHEKDWRVMSDFQCVSQ